MAFEWKERYRLGIEEVDKQHRKLFEIGARAYELALLDNAFDRYDDIMAVLQELLDYAQYHFSYEEDFMRKHNFEDLPNHTKEHNYFVAKVKSLLAREREIDEEQEQTLQEIADFLSEWVSTHIMFVDRKYTTLFPKS
ncbi:MAG TPA: bacteriohemerythrin [Thermoclostridium caenicola]|uniref:Hemerythrin n=1 Tax=Thermoclostridium caenicola TaxID=659425 RepID=A0A1M6JM86_9FIRM|nr:bacteriohemerythrin [Thermoclostridium caenicola]SHJ47798.1 hemerythrin [Thermoclostridium caenicola]HOK44226.1 bacteriohemerythrin [Thermoclostridium caenicola]HOL84911.1 bacteriohemerythrin [Thermoclostridium caenicola]HPO77821.1 bacteriohemerythrin [Thermoclostridium caenicola]